MAIDIYSLYRPIFRIWRARRFRRFVREIGPRRDQHMLDVGGYPGAWAAQPPVLGKIVTLNLHETGFDPGSCAHTAIDARVGDGRHLPFGDKEFDIVFSNSVIEHVGEWDDQIAFAREAARVGKKLWVQTPARECPVEPHFLGLFIHWLPRRWQVPAARWLSVSGYLRPADLEGIASSTRLLGKRDMQRLFPDCEIWTERMLLVIPKSHVAIRR